MYSNNKQQIAEVKLDVEAKKAALLEEQLAMARRAVDDARAAARAEAEKVRLVLEG